MLQVKFCGMTREEDVRAAVEAGADAVGFIVGFPRSPRNISLRSASNLMEGVPPFVETVLVTTAELLSARIQEATKMHIGAVQLYGNSLSPEEVRSKLNVHLIKPIQMIPSITSQVEREAAGFDAILTDTYKPGMQGGTGIVSDWNLSLKVRQLIAPTPLILSGGLNPGNVAKSVNHVRPYAVDASSGVESSPGIKDHGKMKEFVRLAKEAF